MSVTLMVNVDLCFNVFVLDFQTMKIEQFAISKTLVAYCLL